jgi:hypothetical protein
VAASSQDFGADLEHAQALLVKLDELIASEELRERVVMLAERVEKLIGGAASATLPLWLVERVEARADECESLWRDIDTLLKARKQTLEGAVELHAFDKVKVGLGKILIF